MDEEKKEATSIPGGAKVYSPDLGVFSLEGRSGVFGTLASIIVAPIRISTRVVHNVFSLPANLAYDYSNALLITSVVMLVMGIVDLFLYKKWPLLVSQIPAIYYATRLKKRAMKSKAKAEEERIVDINVQEIEELCNTVYTELNEAIND